MTHRGCNLKEVAKFFEGVETLPAMLARRAALTPAASGYVTLGAEGNWTPVTWAAFSTQVSVLAAQFRKHGIAPGALVGILAGTSLGWEEAQLALLECGAVVCGIDPYYPDPLLNRVVAELDLRNLVVENISLLDRLSAPNRRRLNFVVAIHDAADAGSRTVPSLGELRRAKCNGTASASLAESAAPALVVFSSGSTGDPRPTVYTHAQVVHACRCIVELYPEISPTSRFVCWLPLANLFQRMVNFSVMAKGGSSYMVEDPRRVMEVLPIANPEVFIAVPRFCEKLHAGIDEKMATRPLAAWLVNGAISLARPLRAVQIRSTRSLSFKRMAARLADRMVLRRLRAILGANLKCIISGAAPMPRWLLEWFDAIGVPVLEAYGVSENLVPISANRLSERKPGTVGRPVGDNEIRIAQDGEVQVRGRGVFDASLRGNQARRAVLTPDGFLSTGDLGAIDNDGFLTLFGRQGEAFKNDQGRWVSLSHIEAMLRLVPEVEHALAVRMPNGLLLAVLTVTEAAAQVVDQELAQRLGRTLDSLPRAMRPAGLLVVADGFRPATGELTASLKLRRTAIVEKYGSALRELMDRVEKTNSRPGAELPVAFV